MAHDSDDYVNEDPYGFTAIYPVLGGVAFVALWFEAYIVIAACVMFAGLIALTMGLHLGRYLLPLDVGSVHLNRSPRLFWTYIFMQAVVVVLALGVGGAILMGSIG